MKIDETLLKAEEEETSAAAAGTAVAEGDETAQTGDVTTTPEGNDASVDPAEEQDEQGNLTAGDDTTVTPDNDEIEETENDELDAAVESPKTQNTINLRVPTTLYVAPSMNTPLTSFAGPVVVTGEPINGFLPVSCVLAGKGRVRVYIRNR